MGEISIEARKGKEPAENHHSLGGNSTSNLCSVMSDGLEYVDGL